MDSSPPSLADRLRERPWLDLAGLLLLAAAVYASLGAAAFTLDDGLLIASLETPVDATPLHAFTRDFWGITAGASGYYRPLTSLYLAAVYALFGPSPAAFHLLSVALHLATGAVAYGLLRRLAGDDLVRSRTVAALGAGVFLLHPLQQEAVAFVAAVNDLWAALAVLACLWAWIAGRPALAGLALLAGLLFKENAAAALLFLAVHEATHRRLRPGSWAGPLAAVAVYLGLRVGLAEVGLPGGGGEPITPWGAAAFVAHYAQALALPFSVGVWRPLLGAQHAWWVVPTAVAAALALAAAVRHDRDTLPGLVLALTALALTLPTVLHNGYLADRFAYLPLAGLVLVLPTLATRLPLRSLGAIGAAFALACTATTATTAARWQDQVALMAQAERRDPTGLAAHELGKALATQGRLVEALAAFERSASARWPHLPAFAQVGAMQLTLGRPDRALAALDEGLAAGLEPDWRLHVNRATALRLLGRHDHAMTALQEAVSLAPDEPDIFAHVAVLARAAGQPEVHDRALASMVAMGVEETEAIARVRFLAGEAQR